MEPYSSEDSIVAADALVPKHQGISTHDTDSNSAIPYTSSLRNVNSCGEYHWNLRYDRKKKIHLFKG